MRTTKIAPTFLRTSFTEKLVFPTKPAADTRRALREAGFRWNGTAWWRNRNQTGPIKPRDLATLLAPVAADDHTPRPDAEAAAASA